jgi:membrane fusion protein (multidrug efflux system)
VETGQTREGRVEILKGLGVGERVVSAGQVKLRNGMTVAIDDKPAPGERTAAP